MMGKLHVGIHARASCDLSRDRGGRRSEVIVCIIAAVHTQRCGDRLSLAGNQVRSPVDV